MNFSSLFSKNPDYYSFDYNSPEFKILKKDPDFIALKIERMGLNNSIMFLVHEKKSVKSELMDRYLTIYISVMMKSIKAQYCSE